MIKKIVWEILKYLFTMIVFIGPFIFLILVIDYFFNFEINILDEVSIGRMILVFYTIGINIAYVWSEWSARIKKLFS